MLGVLAYVLLGLLLLMVPGFLFTLVLYPSRGDLDFWKRMGASLGLGVLLLIYVGFVLASWRKLETVPFVVAVSVVCAILAFTAYLRGGFDVIFTYGRAATSFLQKFRRPKEPQQQKPPEPEQPVKEGG